MSLVIALFTLLHSAVQGEPAPPAAVVQINEAEQVGRSDDGRAMTPVNQILTPYGKQIDLPGMRPQGLALSPDGRRLAVSGKTNEVVVYDASSGDLSFLQYLSFDRDVKT